MTSRRLLLVVPSDVLRVPQVGASVRSFCEEANVDPTGLAEIELCVVEALNNAIEHAYRFRTGEEVTLLATVTPADLVIEISDSGDPLPAAVLAAASDRLDFDPDDAQNLPERGLGLAIIREVMDEVSYKSLDGRNTLFLLRHLPRGSAAPAVD